MLRGVQAVRQPVPEGEEGQEMNEANIDIPIIDAPEPSFDKFRETRFEYSEYLGDASKGIAVEGFMTHGEVVELFRVLMGGKQ